MKPKWRSETWYIASVIEDANSPEDIIVEACPVGCPSEHIDCEVFAISVEEKEFWASKIGYRFKIEGIEKGWDKETDNPVWDLEKLRKRLRPPHTPFVFRDKKAKKQFRMFQHP